MLYTATAASRTGPGRTAAGPGLARRSGRPAGRGERTVLALAAARRQATGKASGKANGR